MFLNSNYRALNQEQLFLRPTRLITFEIVRIGLTYRAGPGSKTWTWQQQQLPACRDRPPTSTQLLTAGTRPHPWMDASLPWPWSWSPAPPTYHWKPTKPPRPQPPPHPLDGRAAAVAVVTRTVAAPWKPTVPPRVHDRGHSRRCRAIRLLIHPVLPCCRCV
jgi:hypothetical protein